VRSVGTETDTNLQRTDYACKVGGNASALSRLVIVTRRKLPPNRSPRMVRSVGTGTDIDLQRTDYACKVGGKASALWRLVIVTRRKLPPPLDRPGWKQTKRETIHSLPIAF